MKDREALPGMSPLGQRIASWPWWAKGLFASLGSLCLAIGSPPSTAFSIGLIWLGFIPLTVIARTCRNIPPLKTFAVGLAGGIFVGLVGFPWVGETLERFGGFPTPLAYLGLTVFALWTAVPFGLWMLGASRGPARGPVAILWPCVLYLGLAKIWPDFFPYTAMIGLAQTPEWMQAAELGGVPLVEAQVVVVGILVADAIMVAQPRRSQALRVGVAIAIPIASWVLGGLRMGAIDREAAAGPSLRVGIIQPNTALHVTRRGEKMRRLREQSASAQAEGAELIVWPEAGIYPFVVQRPFERDFPDYRRVLRAHRLPTILGVATRQSGDPYEWNTAVVMNAQGEVLGSFDKNVLVPFGEYIPIVDPGWAKRQIPAMSHNHAGEGPVRFEVQLVRGDTIWAGPVICYEDIFDDFSRSVANQPGGIHLFVNLTIDTWFGDTAEPWEHLALAQFRSVEHRIPMVRSVAAGASSYVDANGRLVDALPVRPADAGLKVPARRLVVDVPVPRTTESHPTIYARGGWLLGWICVLLGVTAPLAVWVRRKYSPRAVS